jgi:8-oxo-dGTP pyrophosphatase MutT (NUDIX family)
MTIRHFTASAIVFDEALEHVLLVHHNKIGKWLYPGGHVDPNQTPAEAAAREVEEETGVRAYVVSDPLFAHPAVTVHPAPHAVLEMDVRDNKIGEHRHIDMVYVLRAITSELAQQTEEVSGARWVPIADVAGLDTPAELPALVTDAARWAKARW